MNDNMFDIVAKEYEEKNPLPFKQQDTNEEDQFETENGSLSNYFVCCTNCGVLMTQKKICVFCCQCTECSKHEDCGKSPIGINAVGLKADSEKSVFVVRSIVVLVGDYDTSLVSDLSRVVALAVSKWQDCLKDNDEE